MQEDYLHYIWKFRLFSPSELTTVEGEPIQIIDAGLHNYDAGPDFSNARIIIGSTEWFGNVEIHVNSSDWNAHKHHEDPAYNNVILHVVFNLDKAVKNKSGVSIPTLELKKLFDLKHFEKYKYLISNGLSVPCQQQIPTVPSFVFNAWLDRLLMERLERKTERITAILNKNKGDWEQTFITLIMQYFGMKVNAQAMLDLSEKVPVNLIRKEQYDIFSLEALLFGQAGMLNATENNDSYYSSLRKEYLFLKQKYQLQNCSPVIWKFSKLRPPNFPTLRLAQLSCLFYNQKCSFDLIRSFSDLNTYREVFNVSVSDYWKNHYTFGTFTKQTKSKIGNMLLGNIIINVIVPLGFAYGKMIGDERYCNYSLKLLHELPTEKNHIITLWKNIGIASKNAQTSQALIELYSNYCKNKLCLRCSVGCSVLGR